MTGQRCNEVSGRTLLRRKFLRAHHSNAEIGPGIHRIRQALNHEVTCTFKDPVDLSYAVSNPC